MPGLVKVTNKMQELEASLMSCKKTEPSEFNTNGKVKSDTQSYIGITLKPQARHDYFNS